MATQAATLAFLAGGGEMGDRIRTHDWSETALGPPAGWPSSLRTTLGILLKVRFPMLLWWGPDLIQFYNDAYRPRLAEAGKHPAALGQRGETCWPELWPTTKPLIDQVMAGGEPTRPDDDQSRLIENPDWTFSYSPVSDDTGQVAGVLVVGQVDQAVRVNERLLNAIIQQTPLGVGIFRGSNFIVDLANPTICQLWGRTHEQVVGKPIFEALPEAAGQGFEERLQEVYQTGIPFRGHEMPVTLVRNGHLETVYFDFVYDAIRNRDGRIDHIMVVATEVTQARQARQQIEASEANLRNLFRQAPVAIAILRGPAFVVELANPAICTIWNRTEAQLLGSPVFAVLTESVGQGFEELLTQVLQTGVPFIGHELPVLFRRDGQAETVYVNFVYEPLRDHLNGPITGIVVVGTDVTEQVLVRQQTEQLLVRERELNELKSNFVTLASHEFRTPMGTILSSASLIGRYDGPTDGDRRERHVQRIKSAVLSLTGLLNDFLSISQMEESTLHGRPHPLNIVTFCEELMEDMQAVIKPRQWVVYTHQSGESAISLDGQMLKNILVNLLVNASKYSAEGKKIELTTTVAGDQLRLTVRDEGIGIPDTDKDKLFTHFFRARNVDHVAGTGLGLYVVKRYVDLLGGTIDFNSQLDSGTTFTIQLPLTPL